MLGWCWWGVVVVLAPPPPVPAAMRLLYESSSALPAAAANTARSFHHAASPLDDRFPNEHRFRLYFNLSGVPEDERARGADLTLQRAAGGAGEQRLLLYDVVRPGRRGRAAPLLRLLDSKQLRAGDGAVTLDALGAARRWLGEPRHNHGLLVRILEGSSQEDARAPHVRVRRRAGEAGPAWRAAQPLLLLYTEDERARAPPAPRAPPQGGARRVPAPPAVRGLRRRGLEGLDRGSARLRRLLLPGGLPVPHRRPPERHEPRHRADARELGEPGHGAQGVLCAHGAQLHLHALHGRDEQCGAQELSGHDGGGLRLPMTAAAPLVLASVS